MIHLLLTALLALGSPAPSNQQDVSFVSKDGNVVTGTISWPAGNAERNLAFVLIGEPEAAPATAAALNTAGLTVLRYDARGIGTPSDVDDAEAAVAAIKKDPHADPTRVYLFARGAGAPIAMAAALDAGAAISGIVLASPVLARTATFDPQRDIAKLEVPVLLLHGGADTQVSAADLKAFAAAARAARHSLQYGEFAGDDHLLEAVPPAFDPRAVAAIIAWLAETQ
ncbi:MAG TPA: alpha/beta hydrolase [Candidatus Acidoferrales bacterium]|nr:alpha/beta hydrolase [Candidatus Acidoferrales bacterium]